MVHKMQFVKHFEENGRIEIDIQVPKGAYETKRSL
jgi:hypothetical protein